mmetsp:Transcript_12737/g.24304  ORF Transcript_12737/g.24304 Transcript_12737/m.24304 type:complete len:358 (-) Transcript_12737:381-1454(-)
MLRGPIGYQGAQFLDVEWRHARRYSQVHGDASRHAHLVNSQVRIGRNHRTRRKVDALPHQIAANTPLLRLKPLTQRLERPPAPLRNLRHPPHLVIAKRRHVVLQRLLELLHDDIGFAVLDGRLEGDVGFDDVDELVGEVVLGGLGASAHDDGGSDVEGGDGHDGDAHPFGTGPGDVETEGFDFFVPHLFEDIHGLRRTQKLLLIPATPRHPLHLIRVLDLQMQPHPRILGLKSIAVIALLLPPYQYVHGRQPLLSILDRFRALELVLRVFHDDAAAVEADAAEGLEGDVDEAVVVDGAGEFDVAEVARVGFVVEVAEARVVDASVDGLSCHVGLIPSHPRGNLTSIHGNRLRHRILP